MTTTTADVLAVVSQSGPTVTFFDAATYDRLGAVTVPSQPHELCYDPARRLLYATVTYRSGSYHAHSGRAHELVVIDPDARRLVDTVDLSPECAPHGMALDPSGELLWVCVEAYGNEAGALVALDAASRNVVRRVPVGAHGPHWFVLTPDGRRAYTANKEAPFVSVVDLASGTVTDRIAVPGSEGIAISGDGRWVYVATPPGDFAAGPGREHGVRVIDTATGAIVRTLPAEGTLFPVHVTATGLVLTGELRTATDSAAPGRQAPGLLYVHGPDGDAPLGRIPVGAFPLTITSSPDGRYGYVAAGIAGTVTVVDLERLTTVATLDVPKSGEAGAHGMAYVPALGPVG